MDFYGFGSIIGNNLFSYSRILFLHLLESFVDQYKAQHKNNWVLLQRKQYGTYEKCGIFSSILLILTQPEQFLFPCFVEYKCIIYIYTSNTDDFEALVRKFYSE